MAGAATSKKICRDKSVATNTCFVATKMILVAAPANDNTTLFTATAKTKHVLEFAVSICVEIFSLLLSILFLSVYFRLLSRYKLFK